MEFAACLLLGIMLGSSLLSSSVQAVDPVRIIAVRAIPWRLPLTYDWRYGLFRYS